MSNLRVSVAYAGPEWAGEIVLTVAAGTSVGEAIHAAGIEPHIKNFSIKTIVCGVWGKARPINYLLRDGDRVEIYRPLEADPKDARRAKVAAKKRA